MVNKYSDWSDHDIEFEILKIDMADMNIYIDDENKLIYVIGDPCPFEPKDWTSHTGAALDLCVKYKIGLIPIADKWLASPDILTAMSNDLIPQAQSDNPCRAVAECFLLIGDDNEET